MSLKEMLKGNTVAIGKNYKVLNQKELKLLLSLKCISNMNNFIVGIRKSTLLKLFDCLDKRSFDESFNGLLDKGFIRVEGDLTSYSHIQIVKDESFETFDVEYVLDMLNELSGAEIKLLCVMFSHLNFKKNKNYIFPSDESLAKNYYQDDLTEKELLKKVENKGISKLRNSLLEKKYIKKIAAYRTNNNKKSTFGYFMNTGKDEVVDYNAFVKEQLEKTGMHLATKSNLEKQKYRDLDHYIYSDYTFDDKSETKEQIVNEPTETILETITEPQINTNYEVDLHNLLNEKYPGFDKSKRLKEYISKYGHEKMFDFFIDSLTENEAFNYNANDDLHRANIFYKNKIDKLFKKFLEYEQTREFRQNMINDDVEFVEDVYIPKNYKRENKKTLIEIIKDKQLEK